MPDLSSNLGRLERYLAKAHRPLNCLMFILPLLAAYEAGSVFYRDPLLAPRHLQAVLESLGAGAYLLPGAVIVMVLLIWHVLSRQKWHVDGDALLGMAVESVAWMAPMLVLAAVLDKLLSLQAVGSAPAARPLAASILSGIGAGIYEEFLFRLAGTGLILLLMVDLLRSPRRATEVFAIAFTSVLFSLYHFIGPEQFRWHQFIFRAAAGAYLAGLYVTRGFGIAVGTHACYNTIVALSGYF